MKPLVFAAFGAFAGLACSSTDATTPQGSDASGADATQDGECNCDSGASRPDYQSGTRLRAKVWTSADGARVFHGFYDSLLKTDCAVAIADDGALRCLPLSAHAGVLYSDASCKVPVGFTYDGCAPPAFVSRSSGSCGSSVYPAKGASAAMTFYDQQMACAAYGGTVTNAFDLGAKMDASAFVKGTRTREPRGADLMMELYDMEDGARMPIGAFDTARKSQCASSPFAALWPGRCVPSHVAYGEGQFADSSCTKAAAFVPDNKCSYAPDDVIASAWMYGKGPSCNGELLIGLGNVGPTPLVTAYQKGSNTCTAISFPGTYVPVTGDLAPSALPQLTPTPDGSGRVVRYVDKSGTGEKLAVEGFYDTTLSAACAPSVTKDGKLRCVPTGQSVQWFVDAACKQPVFAATDLGPACPFDQPATWMQLSTSDGKACPSSSTQSFKVGAKVASSPTVYSLNGGSCQANTGSDKWILYGTTEQDPATFAELSDVTE